METRALIEGDKNSNSESDGTAEKKYKLNMIQTLALVGAIAAPPFVLIALCQAILPPTVSGPVVSIINAAGQFWPVVQKYKSLWPMAADDRNFFILNLSILYSAGFLLLFLYLIKAYRLPQDIAVTLRLLAWRGLKGEAQKGKYCYAITLLILLTLLAAPLYGWIFGWFSTKCHTGDFRDYIFLFFPCWQSVFDFTKFDLYTIYIMLCLGGIFGLMRSVGSVISKKSSDGTWRRQWKLILRRTSGRIR